MSERVIDICGVCKSYGDVRALDGVSLSIGRGELFGLIGPDGAGKSTLYRVLTTLTRPDSGTATVLGHDVVKGYKDIRRSLGYMPEQFSLYADLSVRENLNFYASLYGVSVSVNHELIAPVYGSLERFANRRSGALSGGMKQKLALCCALIHRPRVLLLDEPTTGVDAVSRSEFWNILHELRSRGMTIMVSTSYMDEAQMCDRIALTNKGKILETDTPARLAGRADQNLWDVSAAEMYPLLEAVRALPGVRRCYTFGATLHMVTDNDFSADTAAENLRAQGLNDVKIHAAKGDIEDLFIKLMHNEAG